jgi:hypothetical protein
MECPRNQFGFSFPSFLMKHQPIGIQTFLRTWFASVHLRTIKIFCLQLVTLYFVIPFTTPPLSGCVFLLRLLPLKLLV